jgi:hypothetical protein
MIARVPKKSPEQVAMENNTQWEQLVHWANSSTVGLPEHASKKVPAKKAPLKKTIKRKSTSKPKAREA